MREAAHLTSHIVPPRNRPQKPQLSNYIREELPQVSPVYWTQVEYLTATPPTCDFLAPSRWGSRLSNTSGL